MAPPGASAPGHCIGGIFATGGKASAITSTATPLNSHGFGAANSGELGPRAKASWRRKLGLGGGAGWVGAINKPHGGSCAKGANGDRGDGGD
jgi:hypothetical protein